MSGSLKDPGGCAGARGWICALLGPFQTFWLMVLETFPAEEPGLTWCRFSLLWVKNGDRDQRHSKHCCCPRQTQQGLCCCTVSKAVLNGSCGLELLGWLWFSVISEAPDLPGTGGKSQKCGAVSHSQWTNEKEAL